MTRAAIRSVAAKSGPISLIGLPHPERIAARLAAERLQQHATEPELASITKLLDTNRHGVMASRGLGAVGAQQSVPPRQVEAEIAVGLAPQDRMMDAVHIRRHDEPAQDPIDFRGNADVAVVEHRGGIEQDL